MTTFNVPTKNEVNTTNKAVFKKLEDALGFVPNLYATYAHSETALENYLTLSNGKTSLNNKEKEVVKLAVSEVNRCNYCLSAHTAIAKMNGFKDDEILEFREGRSSFNSKFNALAAIAKNMTENRGNTDQIILNNFLNAGYTKANLVDTIVLVGDKTISNYLHSTTKVPVDFPEVLPFKIVNV